MKAFLLNNVGVTVVDIPTAEKEQTEIISKLIKADVISIKHTSLSSDMFNIYYDEHALLTEGVKRTTVFNGIENTIYGNVIISGCCDTSKQTPLDLKLTCMSEMLNVEDFPVRDLPLVESTHLISISA